MTAAANAWDRAVQERNWLIFAITPKDEKTGKFGKYPTDQIASEYAHEQRPFGTPVSAYNAAHYTFEEAWHLRSKLQPDGVEIVAFEIGYLPRQESALIVGDLDNCIDVISGNLLPWAEDILSKGTTYTERSTSGNGVRLLMERMEGDDQISSGERNDVGLFANGGKAAVLTFRDKLCDSLPMPVPGVRDAVLSRKGTDPKSRNRDPLSNEEYGPVDNELLAAVVAEIPNDGRYGYDDWINIGHAIQATNDGPAGWEVFQGFSERYRGKVTECPVKKWSKGLDANGEIGFGTLVHMAREANGGKMSEPVEQLLREKISAHKQAAALEQMPPVKDPKALEVRQRLANLVVAPTVETEMQLKELKSEFGIGIGALRRELAQMKSLTFEDEDTNLTHAQIANSYYMSLPEPKAVPNGGEFWFCGETDCTWHRCCITKVAADIGQTYVDQRNCKRQSDYKGISQHLYDAYADENFFNDAPRGIMAGDGFYRLLDGRIKRETASPEHRAIFSLAVEPDFSAEPTLFLETLKEAFRPSEEQMTAQVDSGIFPSLDRARFAFFAEKHVQLRNLQKAFGGTLFGLMTQYEKALLLYGAAGSFKSKTIKILKALIDKDATCSVSPHDLGQDYDRSFLANKLLNVVPEIDEDKPIAAGSFKAMVTGDTMKGRNPYEKPFNFAPKAAHWFAGNHYITTKDMTEGFWRRWPIFRFWTGKPQEQRDTTLFDRIIETELAAIVAWAFKGAELLVAHGFEQSATQRLCLDEWRVSYDSVMAWLNANDNGVYVSSERSGISSVAAYKLYKAWCTGTERRPLGRNKFLSRLAEAGHPQSRGIIKTLQPR